jgi:beta-xylosidase
VCLLQVIIIQQGKFWLIYTIVKRNLCIITGNFRNNSIIRIDHDNDDDDDDDNNNNNNNNK